jgi:hypothetical protein
MSNTKFERCPPDLGIAAYELTSSFAPLLRVFPFRLDFDPLVEDVEERQGIA